MVTSVNASALAALQALEAAQAGRTSDARTAPETAAAATVTDPGSGPQQPVVYSGSADAPNLAGILSVQESLNRAASITDAGVSGGQAILGLLGALKDKVTAAQSGQGVTDQQKAEYQSLLEAIDKVAKSASFQGVNLLDGSSTGDLTFKTDASGSSLLRLTPQDFTAGGLGLASTDLAGSADDLTNLLTQVNSASVTVQAGVSQMSGTGEQVQGHLGVVGQLVQAMGGRADLDADSARLLALQIQQTLSGGVQSLANQTPQAVLALFRTAT